MFLKIFAIAVLLNLAAYAQQSLGDIARQYREKLAAEEAAGTGPRMYTNQDIPPAQQVGTPEPNSETRQQPRDLAMNRAFDDPSVEQRSTEHLAEQRAAVEWRNRIQAQESRLADLQSRIDRLSTMIHSGSTAQYDGPYTRSQARAQERLDQMQQLLDWQKRRLEQMQDAARHAGMHSAVYEP
jgi:hypothetical protein